jgi:hypothetical protein
MMQDVKQLWYKRFRVPEKALDEIEKQLFQLNIHDLSLFPDIAGLAALSSRKYGCTGKCSLLGKARVGSAASPVEFNGGSDWTTFCFLGRWSVTGRLSQKL